MTRSNVHRRNQHPHTLQEIISCFSGRIVPASLEYGAEGAPAAEEMTADVTPLQLSDMSVS